MKFLVITLILYITIIFQSHADLINNSYLENKKTHDFFCNKIINNKLLNINNEWLLITRTKTRHSYINKKKKKKLSINLFYRFNKVEKLIFTFYNKQERPYIEIRSNRSCLYISIRKIIYNKNNVAEEIQSINIDLNSIENRQYINPKIPILKSKKNQNIIALVDTGVNYTLEKIKSNIAVKDGKLLGYDFWDDDKRPFDGDPRQNPFYPRHHGTTVFSVLAKEAPKSLIAIYRFPALDMCKFDDLIEHIAQNSIRIVNLSMGSNKIQDWLCFKKAVEKHNQIIFIVSAGNNDFNLDHNPIYPASLKLKNIITVSSSDKNGRVGRGSNIGPISVDIMVPAERVEVIDHRGVKAYTGGTSYAAPRIAALISRYLHKKPKSSVNDVLKFIEARAIKNNKKTTKFGWIPDPLDDYLIN